MEKWTEPKCVLCNKEYKSKKSLWNHNKKYHQPDISHKPTDDKPNISQKQLISYSCNICNKEYKHFQSRWKHEQKCKKVEKEKEKEDEFIELKNKMKKLEKLIKKSGSHNIKQNANQIMNGNINNNTYNHIQINALGFEDIKNKLTDNEKLNILTSGIFDEFPIIELVRKTYMDDKLKDNRNTMITNLQNTSCLTYNKDTNQFDAVNKMSHIDNLIKCRKDDIIKMYEDMNKKIKPNHKQILEEYLDKIESIKENEMYKKHKEEIIYIIYNCKNYMKELKEKLDEIDALELSELSEID